MTMYDDTAILAVPSRPILMFRGIEAACRRREERAGATRARRAGSGAEGHVSARHATFFFLSFFLCGAEGPGLRQRTPASLSAGRGSCLRHLRAAQSLESQNFEAVADCQEGAAGGGASPLLIFWRIDLATEYTVIYPLLNSCYPLA